MEQPDNTLNPTRLSIEIFENDLANVIFKKVA
jgi:hypothetical protein